MKTNKILVKPISLHSFKKNLECGNICSKAKVHLSSFTFPDGSSAWLLENKGDENPFTELVEFCKNSFGEKNVLIFT